MHCKWNYDVVFFLQPNKDEQSVPHTFLYRYFCGKVKKVYTGEQ